MQRFLLVLVLTLLILTATQAGTLTLESSYLKLEVDGTTGRWTLEDKRSGTRWPSEGTASPGTAAWLAGNFAKAESPNKESVRLQMNNETAVVFTLVDQGRAIEIRYETQTKEPIRLLDDALGITDAQGGYIIVPCREGLLIPANSGKEFKQVFGTSEYEGCHINMLGFVKAGSALVATWDDAYVFPELQSTKPADKPYRQRLTAVIELRNTARSVRLTPLGKGDWNTIAEGYRRYAEQKGLAVTLREKIRRNKHVELMVGAANAKLWTCLARRMNEESTQEESVKVHWTFDEAAQVAEHLRKDVGIERCLFIMGGWTEGGYDCRHPDNLPANPECGGNEKLAEAVKRIQDLGYIACLHDNYQDMYRDAKSWNPSFIEKQADGSLIKGGRWLGGRAYMVCAPKQLELSKRSQNLPETGKLFAPWSYFIDTTYAVGPRECHDPNHPIGRNDDIAWKISLSDYAREIFGTFGSECGREWAIPHSDFFEGLVGVSGRYYHNLKPETISATVIPFFEMVYHDCQISYGKYGYSADQAGEYVAHHVLCARPLHYHSFPDHIYWQSEGARKKNTGPASDLACYTRSDSGWAEGMHPVDVFLKNTQEILGPLHSETAFNRLGRLELLTPDRTVRQAVYGEGKNATKVIVNFGGTEAKISTTLAGEAILPPWGFIVESPGFAAFYARRWGGIDYPNGALFTLQATDKKSLMQSGSIRIFHGFGPVTITWKGINYDVQREQVIQPK
jgi:hypothetical protein